MRRAVRKPQPTLKLAIKAQLPSDITAIQPVTAAMGHTVGDFNPTRLARAKNTPQSSFIRRFGNGAIPDMGNHQSDESLLTHKKMPAEAAASHVKSSSKGPTADMFESAIASATSHQQKPPRVARRRGRAQKVVGGIVTLCTLLVVCALLAYINLTTIELRFASMEAGFNATVPNYRELGFSLEAIKLAGKTVAMNFLSGNTSFTLTQQASNWDSQTLLETMSSETDSLPQTLQSDGHTIYVFANNHATWVSGGIHYDINGNTNLNTQEITSFADSM